jgi:N-acetylmuramoyl-L-alanine amidase
MVPIRFISQNMGYKVDWEKLDQKIIIKNHENIMNLWVGKNILLKNNQIFLSDTYPELHNGRTMVPLRLISELMGYEVVWDPSFNKVEIKLH